MAIDHHRASAITSTGLSLAAFRLLPILLCSLVCGGCVSLEFGPGSRAKPEMTDKLVGVDSLVFGSNRAIVSTGIGYLESLNGQCSHSLTLIHGAGFKICGFNTGWQYEFVEVRDGRAIFDFHTTSASCFQPSPTEHTFNVISVAEYGVTKIGASHP